MHAGVADSLAGGGCLNGTFGPKRREDVHSLKRRHVGDQRGHRFVCIIDGAKEAPERGLRGSWPEGRPSTRRLWVAIVADAFQQIDAGSRYFLRAFSSLEEVVPLEVPQNLASAVQTDILVVHQERTDDLPDKLGVTATLFDRTTKTPETQVCLARLCLLDPLCQRRLAPCLGQSFLKAEQSTFKEEASFDDQGCACGF